MAFIKEPREGFVPQNWDEHFKTDELAEYLNVAYRRFYFRPRFILQSLKELSNAKDFLRKARAGLTLLKPRALQA